MDYLNTDTIYKAIDTELIFLAYLSIINLLSFTFMSIDKVKAKNRKYRISENMLIGLSVIGGSTGTLLGMVLFKHKTNKKKFYIGVPIIYILNQIIIFVIFRYIK